MTTTIDARSHDDPLSVLLDFRIESGGWPKPSVLDAYCTKYPQHAQALTDYALLWLIDEATSWRGMEPPGVKDGVIVDASYWLWIDAKRMKSLPAEGK